MHKAKSVTNTICSGVSNGMSRPKTRIPAMLVTNAT
jgi:hypothetical protein